MSDMYDREQAEAAEEEATGGIFSGFSIGQHNVAKLHAARAKIKVQARMIELLEKRLKLLQSHLQTIFNESNASVITHTYHLQNLDQLKQVMANDLDDVDISDHEDEARNYTKRG